MLLDTSADIEASDDSGSTALMYAAREGRLGLFKMLLKSFLEATVEYGLRTPGVGERFMAYLKNLDL